MKAQPIYEVVFSEWPQGSGIGRVARKGSDMITSITLDKYGVMITRDKVMFLIPYHMVKYVKYEQNTTSASK